MRKAEEGGTDDESWGRAARTLPVVCMPVDEQIRMTSYSHGKT